MSESRKVFVDGIWNNNPIFVQFLGMCPLLGVSTSAINGVGMGIATTAVLVGSNMAIAGVRKFIPNDVRIPAFIVLIAAFVTVIDLLMNAFVHDLHKVLGLYIPLIVVNCIILGRAEAYAFKNTVLSSMVDGLASGLGFTVAITLLGGVREILGSGQIFGFDLFGSAYHPAIAFIMPPGAFLALAGLLILFKWLSRKSA
ncbi:MAG: electron transport complex subunit E [Magnetococcales bacterium]|nr:electron transport complex subunit E [Magnetococcales bacterium]